MVPQDFFNYTSGRWIYNEKQQLEARHIDFSVDALKKAAAEALNVHESFNMIKLREGLFNRAFLLSNAEGTEVIARLPTSLVGSQSLTTASEVATLKLMETLGIPVPKVLSYSCCAESKIGSEYILMERAKGIPLLSVWGNMSRKRRGQVITQLIGIDSKLLALNFSGYGSIYLKDDLPETSGIPLSTDPSLSEYQLGPSVERSWWAKQRRSMSIDRGPCKPLFDPSKRRDAINRCLESKGSTRDLLDSIICTTSRHGGSVSPVRLAGRPNRTYRSASTIHSPCSSLGRERGIRTTHSLAYGPSPCQHLYRI